MHDSKTLWGEDVDGAGDGGVGGCCGSYDECNVSMDG